MDSLKRGKFNELEAGKAISSDEIQRLRRNIEDTERQIQDLQKENLRLRQDSERVQQYQSAFMSN